MAGLSRVTAQQRNPLGTAIRTQGSGKYTFGLALSAGLAGLLYGYDTVSISGAIEFLRTKYGLNSLMEGLVISSIMLGAIIGAATAGFLSDKYGRRRLLIIGGAFFFIAAIWSALTWGPIDLIVARTVGGYGIGLTASLAVTYITESAPTNIRGLLSFSYQMFAVCGIFLTNVINYIIASHGTSSWDISNGWRWMLGLGALPSAAFLLAMIGAPESPRYLIQAGKIDEGFTVLEHILGTERARLRTDDINASIQLEREMSNEFHDLFRPGLRRALGIGIFLAVFNQLIGMNAISYYGPVMFSQMGFGGDTEFLAAASVGGVELVATVVGMYLIDTFGRKRLMEIGSGMMCIFAACISVSYLLHSPLLMLISVMAFTAAFAFSMGPIPWIVIPELFPTYLRGRATGLCVMFLLFANWMIAQFTPILIDGLGGGVAFAIFGVLDLVCMLGVILLVPETMGRTLEDIERLWQPKTELAAAKYALSSADANIRHAEATLRRVENERMQALGIMSAAQHARVVAQQRVFALEAAERERIAATHAAEQSAQTTQSVATSAQSPQQNSPQEVAHHTVQPSRQRTSQPARTATSASHQLVRNAVPAPPNPALPARPHESADADHTNRTGHTGDDNRNAAMLSGSDAEDAARAAVDTLDDEMPDDLSALFKRSRTSHLDADDDPTGGILLSPAIEAACAAPAYTERFEHETEDAREARAIDAALDSLDAFIKA
ncbi:sugar porter family MFS transporter [Bifidobacterium scaligerum]|uniref:MFS transporter n=1 Tax=Bifidobacterium scaligerum TaxID=2052656 RepID=A0A2M9HPZ9_9BIFI|nr:sugar porter family MFS transporter [Bifidobacterium scaligerum]PJM78887.1 MFS transporter [Bifidobacterium scaligerum]